MSSKKSPTNPKLRQRAEEIALELSKQTNQNCETLSDEAMQKLLHELQVHQIELEMQNEELRKTQLELEISRERYFDLYDLAPVGICTLSEGGIILETNLATANFLGLSRNKLVTQVFSNFVFSEDQEIYYHLRKHLFDTGKPQKCELRLVRNADREFWVYLVAERVANSAGSSTWQLVLNDITDRMLVERALKESQAAYKNLYDHAPIGYHELDQTGRITRINQTELTMLGYSELELLGKPVWELVVEDDIAEKAVNAKLRGAYEDAHAIERTYLRKDGSELPVLVMDRILRSVDGHIYGIRSTVQDITAQKAAQTALLKSEEKYRHIFGNVQDVYYETLLDGTIIEVSPSIEKLSKGHYQRTDLIGKSMYAFYSDPGARDSLLEAIRKTGQLNDYEVELKNRDDSIFSCSINAIIISDAQGRPEKIVGSLHDITDRKVTEEALRHSEKRLRDVLDATPFPVAVVDVNNEIVQYWSHTAHVLFGHTPASVADWYDAAYPDQDYQRDVLKRWKSALEKARKTGKSVNTGEYQITCQDDSVRTCVLHALFLQDSLIITFHDISERKLAEHALHESTLMIEGIIKTVPARIFWKDTNLIYMGCNLMFARDAGFAHPDEVIGKDDYQMVWHEQAELYRRDDQEVLNSGSGKFLIEESQTTPDGNIITLLTNKIAMRDVRGEITGILGTYVDISEHKHAEQTLAESAEKYRLLFENINDAVAITQNGKYIYFNQQFCQMLGYTAAEMDHKDRREVISEAGLQILDARQQIRQRGEEPPARYETSFVRKDGQLINIEANVRIIDFEGQSAAFAVLRDVTERKKAESEISQALLEAKQAGTVKDQFIANISHEIRTPLNSLIGFSDLFSQRYGELVNQKDKDIFKYITSSSNRLMRTVDSILTFSELSAGTLKIDPHAFDLNYLVRTVVVELLPAAEEKGLALTFIPADHDVSVFVDNYSIHQAILNLVQNAIKFTSAGKVELRVTHLEDRLGLVIQDTGIGISESYQRQIFQPYTQESEGFTKMFQGIGLGLALTKRYLDLNRVELTLTSKQNVGTTFTLFFPHHEGNKYV